MTRQPYLSARLQGFGTTVFAQMSALAEQTKAINLGQGFPDIDGPEEVARVAANAVLSGPNQYPPVQGDPALRQAVAEHQQRFWGQTVDPDSEVLVTAGATEAITAALLALCEPGDEVVAFDPTYDSYAAATAMAGARLRTVVLRPPPAQARTATTAPFSFDPDELRRAFSARTRMFLLNTPHNPTGKVFTRDELAFIAELCIEHDIIAITDEVYEHLAFARQHHQLAAQDGMRDRTLTVSSGGKTFSFTGWKVGWITGPSALVGAVRTAKQFLTFVNAAPLQPAIAAGLRLGPDYFTGFTSTLEAKRDRLVGWLTQAGFAVYVPEGTYFVIVDITPVGGTDSVDFCLALPERCGVVAVPASVFYQDPRDGQHLIRFCFAKQDAVLDEAGQRLVDGFGPPS